MMVIVVATFALCWLPYHIYFILGSFNIDIYKQPYIQQVSSCLCVIHWSLTYLPWISHFFVLTGVSGHFLAGHEFDHVQPHHLLLSKPKVTGRVTPRNHPSPSNSALKTKRFPYFRRFRAGFRHAFAWCPFVKVSEEDKMELQHTHTFRVTMTRSHRRDSAPTKINNTHDVNVNTERDAPAKTSSSVKAV